MASTDSKFRFAIDRGGTFTDVYCLCPGDKVRTMKLLSVDPANYKDAPTEAIRRILEQETGVTVPKNQPINAANIEWIRMGTTVATNALLERKGERCALLITRGFKDLLHIGNQARPEIFDLEIKIPGPLYDRVVEVDERVVVNDDRCGLKGNPASGWKEVTGENGEACFVTRSLNVSQLRKDLEELRRMGFNSLAVALMHSYVYRKHEDLVKRIAQDEMGFTSVSLSSEVMPMVKIVPRGYTACVDAYLTPLINRYVKDFLAGFTNTTGTTLLFMQSDGGLTPVDNFSGSRAILSGPAGGVVGYAYTTHTSSPGTGVIGFDMGGTSTDVSRYAGHLEHVFESVTGGVTIQAPQLDVVTVAAGGGSVLSFQSGLFYVGPESAGAHPGPACYRKNGPLAITDANLVLGRLLPQYFPCIFGPKEDQPLDVEASRFKMTQVMNSVNEFKKVEALRDGKPFEPLTVEEVAMGFVRVANETMSRPIRNLTQARGFDARDHELACFGGAGAQHACAIARALGMSRVHVHKYAGILSAFGMALADVVQEAQEFCGRALDGEETVDYVNGRMVELRYEVQTKLQSQGFDYDTMMFTGFMHLRYKGTDYGIMCEITSNAEWTVEEMTEIFETSYQQEFGFIMPDRTIVIDDLRIRGTGNVLVRQDLPSTSNSEDTSPPVDCITQVYFVGGYRDTKVHVMNALKPGHRIVGPAIIIDDLCTILIEPDCVGIVTDTGDLVIDVTIADRTTSKTKGLEAQVVDPIQLSIFSHRFMSIAEQMGRVLQRTAISTNIKERLDFSCALFGPDGGLVSNAPHIPVHLGSMQHAVQYQIEAGTVIEDGDVILSNHPSAGGTHLPDLTVITPVFRPGESKPVFYVASRGHHADIGGSRPGSMPPDSRTIFEEGASFKSFKIVSKGTFMEKELRREFAKPGIEHADLGCSGARNITDNLADLKAQIAANRKGIALVNDLINYYGLDVVQSYMKHIRRNAELAVRDLIKAKAKTLQSVHVSMASMTSRGGSDDGAVIDRPVLLRAADWMDDGTKIKLCVSMSPKTGDAVFDFSGTGYQVWGNCNAPPAIAYSAIIYCLRCMVNRDIPLNQGCLNSVRVILPDGSILKPREDAAVVGGNVLTSQRLVDVIFKAFGACAASQGCMNNLTFGDETFGYYETIAGGAGAGPHWHGRSGVHTHMTNTRITDPEIFERRYPVVLEVFQLREGSGGKGRYRGGDGVVRRIRFRAKRGLDASLLTERRVFAPYGVLGGQNGAPGLNLLRRTESSSGAGQQEEVLVNLGSKSSLRLGPGDIIEIQTPGGGGWGGNYDVEEDEGCLLDDDVEIAASLRAESQHLVD